MLRIASLLVLLTVSNAPQSAPVAAPFAGGALFVWKEGTSLRAGIYRTATPIAKSIALPGERCSITPADDFALLLCTNAAVRIDKHGDEIGPRKTIALSAPLSAAAVGDRFLYVIEELLPNGCGFECPPGGGKIDLQPIDPDGNPLSEVVITADGWMSRIATDGHELALVWTKFSADGIHARRFAADGTFLGDEVAISGGRAYGPRVVWDGQRYDVAFQRDVLRAIAPGVDVVDRRFVDLARLTPDLTTLSLNEAPLGDALPSELVVAGDHLLRAYVIASRIVVDELPLRPHDRAAVH